MSGTPDPMRRLQVPRPHVSTLRRIWKRLGLGPTVLTLSCISVLTSVVITTAMQSLFREPVGISGLLIAVIVPAVVAPGFSYLLLRLVIDLEATQDRLRLLAMHDDLTGAFNRRHFLEEAERELARAQRYGTPFSLVLFDLDDFKQVNDTFGHAAGDHVLRVVSDRCTESARSLDTFARYGGEEFVFVLPATDHTQALAFAERVRRVLADSGISFQDQEMHITASLGVTTFSARTRNLDDLLTAADEAVYRAKAQGKNKVVSGER